MFFVDKPYVSELFKTTVRDHNIPVVSTDIAGEMGLYRETNFISEDKAIEIVQNSPNPLVYAISENSIDWVLRYFNFSDLSNKV